MNSIVLSGRLTRDPELRHTSGGDAVCNMRLAVDRAGGKTDDGYGAGFFDVQCWNRQAELAAQYLTKGSRVAFQGELRYREWEKDGQKRNATEVNAFRVEFLDTRADREEREAGGGDYQQSTGAAATGDFDADFPAAAAEDDIPFLWIDRYRLV